MMVESRAMKYDMAIHHDDEGVCYVVKRQSGNWRLVERNQLNFFLFLSLVINLEYYVYLAERDVVAKCPEKSND
jgi:hypothetical protein